MRILAVKTTVLPDGHRIEWHNGMPQHKYLAMDSALFNRWEGQESALRLAKEILK